MIVPRIKFIAGDPINPETNISRVGYKRFSAHLLAEQSRLSNHNPRRHGHRFGLIVGHVDQVVFSF